MAAIGPNKDPTPLDEIAKLQSISWYGQSKKDAEGFVRSYDGQISSTILRLSVVYGEREKDISQTFPEIERALQPS